MYPQIIWFIDGYIENLQFNSHVTKISVSLKYIRDVWYIIFRLVTPDNDSTVYPK